MNRQRLIEIIHCTRRAICIHLKVKLHNTSPVKAPAMIRNLEARSHFQCQGEFVHAHAGPRRLSCTANNVPNDYPVAGRKKQPVEYNKTRRSARRESEVLSNFFGEKGAVNTNRPHPHAHRVSHACSPQNFFCRPTVPA